MRLLIKIVLAAIFVLFILPPLALFSLALLRGPSAKVPGQAQFDEMNQSISSYHEVEAFGNTPEAEAIAQAFATAIKDIRAESFTKGKEGSFSLSKGHFITTCRIERDTVVLLCHVPEFRRFSDEAKGSLMEIAWKLAQVTAAPKDAAAQPRRLALGLRGIALYYQFWTGQTAGSKRTVLDSKEGREALYRLLAPAAAAPAGAPAPAPGKAPAPVEAPAATSAPAPAPAAPAAAPTAVPADDPTPAPAPAAGAAPAPTAWLRPAASRAWACAPG